MSRRWLFGLSVALAVILSAVGCGDRGPVVIGPVVDPVPVSLSPEPPAISTPPPVPVPEPAPEPELEPEPEPEPIPAGPYLSNELGRVPILVYHRRRGGGGERPTICGQTSSCCMSTGFGRCRCLTTSTV